MKQHLHFGLNWLKKAGRNARDRASAHLGALVGAFLAPTPSAFVFMLKIFMTWLALNFMDMVAFGGAGRAFLASAEIDGFQAFGMVAIGALVGWAIGWSDRRRHGEG